jgi:hypothetical protein
VVCRDFDFGRTCGRRERFGQVDLRAIVHLEVARRRAKAAVAVAEDVDKKLRFRGWRKRKFLVQNVLHRQVCHLDLQQARHFPRHFVDGMRRNIEFHAVKSTR